MARPNTTAGAWALGVSLGVHALVGVWLWLAPVEPPPTRTAALRWVDVEAEPPPERAPTPPPSNTAEPTTKKKKKDVKAAPVASSPPSVSSPGPALVDDRPTANGAGELAVPGTQTTQPKRSLTPGLGFVMRLPEAADAEDTRGTTMRNDPRDMPDAVAVAEYQAEKAGRKLSLDLAVDVARAQQGAGRLPGFFTDVSRSLQAAAADAGVTVSRDSRAAERLNAIGSIIDPTRTRPSDSAVAKVTESAFAQSNLVAPNPALPGDQQAFNQAVLQGFTRKATIEEGLSATRLRTVVSLTTDPRGVLAEASIEERSGDRSFDESALHLSRKVLRAMPDSDEKALGTSWWKSRWVFTWEPPQMRVRLLEATPLSTPLGE